MKIQISNRDGQKTSEKNALRYIQDGRAEWDGPRSIRFIETDHRVISVARRALYCAASMRMESDPTRLLDQLAHIPVVMPMRLLYTK
jgi:hypothetical protein